jgi:hypothetical protein
VENAIRSEAGDATMMPTNPPEPGALSLSLAPPLPPPPRASRRRPGRGWLLRRVPAVVWLLGVPGVGLLLPAVWLLLSSVALALFGSTVPGKITGKTVSLVRGHTTYRVQFSYYVGEQEHEAEASVDEAAFGKASVGAAAKARVLRWWPDEPRLAEPVRPSGGNVGQLLFLSILCNAALGITVWACLRKPLRQRRLVRTGVAATGWVVRKDVNVARPTSWQVQYGYRAPRHGLCSAASPGADGDTATGDKEWHVVMTVGKKDFDAVAVSAPVTVLYDPAMPFRSVIYAFADYELAPAAYQD